MSRLSLVLGGFGFLGSHLIDALLASGRRVRCFDRPLTRPVAGFRAEHPRLKILEGDFASTSDLSAAVDGCSECFHLVSTTMPKSSNVDPLYDAETNLFPTLRLLEQLRRSPDVGKLVFVSSGGTVYGVPQRLPISESHPTDPTCSYGIVKLAIEKYLELYRQLHGVDYTVLRLANAYGERQRPDASQGAVAVFLGKALRDEEIEIWGDGSVVRDYVHVADIARALLAAAESKTDQRIFNIGSGRGTSLLEVVSTIEKVLGRPVRRRHSPGRAFDVPASILDIDAARRELAWTPEVDFASGVGRAAAWLRTHQELRP